MEKRIMDMYNDAWKVYKQYLTNHNLAQFQQNVESIIIKYDCQPDIKGLVVWFMARVQGLNDEYMRSKDNDKTRRTI